jgi:putative membrane protein insertion efficiency factor
MSDGSVHSPKTTRTSSLAARGAAFLVRIYQWVLSPLKQILFGTSCGCRFQPTCSHYSREAFLQHGFWRGCVYSFLRILRCHPWHKGGYDPVPSLKSLSRSDIPAPFETFTDG